MAEILINAEEVRSCVKYKSGKVCIWLDGVKEIREVPPHGRLVDIDKMISQARTDKFPIDIHSAEELADFLEIYADLDKTDHTIVIEASTEERE